MTFAFVDKLAKGNNGVKYSVIRKVRLAWLNCRCKGVMKTKDYEQTVMLFPTMSTKKSTKENWVDKGTELAGGFKIFWNARGIQLYSTLSETKTTFAERTMRPMKKILYRYRDNYG